MEIIKESNITYYDLSRICLRLYGLYLLVTGMLDLLITLSSIMSESEFGMYYFLRNGNEAFTGLVDIFIGISLLFFSSQIARKLIEQRREISVKAEELYYIVQMSLKFLLVIVFISFFNTLLAGSIVLILIAINESFQVEDFLTLIVPIIFLIITYILFKNIKRIISIVMK